MNTTIRTTFVAKKPVQLFCTLLLVYMVAACSSTKGSTHLEIEPTTSLKNTYNNERVSTIAVSVIEVFDQFLERHNIDAGAIAVSYRGQLVNAAGKNRGSDEPARVASLSKSITAICTMKALTQAGENPSMSLAAALPEKLHQYASHDTRYGKITVAQLITHTSGIQTNHLAKQGRYITRFDIEQKDWQLRNILELNLPANPGSAFYYSNANYLILGVLIEKLTNEDYESYCRREVLMPAGVNNAFLAPRWRILTSYGGWKISAQDMLHFVDFYFQRDSIMGLPLSGQPSAFRGGSVVYSLGTDVRTSKRGLGFSHGGTITWRGEKQNSRFAAYFESYNNDFSVSLNYALDSRDGLASELRNALKIAVFNY